MQIWEKVNTYQSTNAHQSLQWNIDEGKLFCIDFMPIFDKSKVIYTTIQNSLSISEKPQVSTTKSLGVWVDRKLRLVKMLLGWDRDLQNI